MFELGFEDRAKEVQEMLAVGTDGLQKPYQDRLPFVISKVAADYCHFNYSEEAIQVLRIAKADLFERGHEYVGYTQKLLDKRLESTAITIPKWLRFLPLYPAKKYRRADEIREMFAKPPTQDETFKMFQEAKKYKTIQKGYRSQCEIVMQAINAPLNAPISYF